MPQRRAAKPPPRPPLSRDLILQAASELADLGTEMLTMRKLAQNLGVEAMSLYHHVSNKNVLLEGITDLVMREIEFPDPADGWRDAVRRCALSAHQVFVRHPWACNVALDSPSGAVPPARFLFMEWMLRTLRTGGFSPDLACHAYHALDSHIMGFSLWARNFPATKEELAEAATEFMPELPPDEFPCLIEHVGQHLNPTPGRKGDFEFALDLLLDGLERARDEEAQ